MVQRWSSCKRRWYNHYVRRLRKEDENFAAFGAATHTFLKNHYTKPETTIDQHKAQFTADFPETVGSDKRTTPMGHKLIEKYLETYPIANEPFKVVEVEQQRQTVIPGLKKPLNYTIDMKIEYRNGLWLLEHKTTSRGGATYFRQYRLDYQNIAYLKGASVEYGKKVEGILYNVLVANDGLFRKDSKENFLRDDMVACKTQQQIDYIWQSFCNLANDMVEYVEKHWEDVEKFPLSASSSACWAYMTACPFIDICEFADNVNLWES